MLNDFLVSKKGSASVETVRCPFYTHGSKFESKVLPHAQNATPVIQHNLVISIVCLSPMSFAAIDYDKQELCQHDLTHDIQ